MFLSSKAGTPLTRPRLNAVIWETDRRRTLTDWRVDADVDLLRRPTVLLLIGRPRRANSKMVPKRVPPDLWLVDGWK
jgi:hypothetical protein